MSTVPVVFRKDRSGEFKGQVTAIFPTLEDGFFLTCYAHIGQHGSCSRTWIRHCTVPAQPDDYADLLAELTTVYADDALVVRRRIR